MLILVMIMTPILYRFIIFLGTLLSQIPESVKKIAGARNSMSVF